jgi:RNA polymerase sigma-70 factor (ECF subfamily)
VTGRSAGRETPAGREGGFATTRWSVVLEAARQSTPASREALSTLCSVYWYPLYAYLRRRGHGVHEAQDLTQGFFARFLEKNYLQVLDPGRGKFRSYLLKALEHYLANEWDRARAEKRGGRASHLPLDLDSAESRYALEPSHESTPEKIFERRWALTLLERALDRLRESYSGSGKARLFGALKPYLTGGEGEVTYREAGAALGLSEGAVKLAVHRLRGRFREMLRAEIAQTVSTEAEIEDEIRHLFSALGS